MMNKIFLALSAVFLAGTVLFASPAEACRDCPFPMRIGDNTWLMPNGQVVVEIDETPASTYFVNVHVTLRDPQTNEVLAAGSARRHKTKRDLVIQLIDRGGHRVRGEIRWVDFQNSVIRARFSCDGRCAITKLID